MSWSVVTSSRLITAEEVRCVDSGCHPSYKVLLDALSEVFSYQAKGVILAVSLAELGIFMCLSPRIYTQYIHISYPYGHLWKLVGSYTFRFQNGRMADGGPFLAIRSPCFVGRFPLWNGIPV